MDKNDETFQEPAQAARVIGKVLRGDDARRLLYYLYGPGRANEHVDPHLVAGFDDPVELEPSRRPDGSRDFRRLAGLLAQPMAALAGPGFDRSVWHCAVRAAPDDRLLTDSEWAQVAAGVMNRTGLAPEDDDLGVRWVAIRHGPDHVHIVATLARQDGIRPRIWNDFYRVREACHQAERQLGLRPTAPADRTAARRATRAETEQAARRGWEELPRVQLRREVCIAAAGARTEQEFFTRLEQAGILVRLRYSTIKPGELTGYAVGLPQHTARDGGAVWYGGGKLAADLTLPKLRPRWARPQGAATISGAALSAPVARAVLRNAVICAAREARDEAGFFARLREEGVQVRLRFSEIDPTEVTGYSVALAGRTGPDGTLCWHAGGRLAAGFTLPRLRADWVRGRPADPRQGGAFRFTARERSAIYEHAARQATAAADHVRRCAYRGPSDGADAAWATADMLHVAARALGSHTLRCAAAAYDRAGRARHGRTPQITHEGDQLRAAVRLMALAGDVRGDRALPAAALIANLMSLAAAVGELRQAQQHAAQAAAARAAAAHLSAPVGYGHSPVSGGRQARMQRPGRPATASAVAHKDFPTGLRPRPWAATGSGQPGAGIRGGLPRRRAGPGR